MCHCPQFTRRRRTNWTKWKKMKQTNCRLNPQSNPKCKQQKDEEEAKSGRRKNLLITTKEIHSAQPFDFSYYRIYLFLSFNDAIPYNSIPNFYRFLPPILPAPCTKFTENVFVVPTLWQMEIPAQRHTKNPRRFSVSHSPKKTLLVLFLGKERLRGNLQNKIYQPPPTLRKNH